MELKSLASAEGGEAISYGAHDPGALLPLELEAPAAPVGLRLHREVPGARNIVAF